MDNKNLKFSFIRHFIGDIARNELCKAGYFNPSTLRIWPTPLKLYDLQLQQMNLK